MTGYLKERHAVYVTYIVTDHTTWDQAPHWGKKEKLIEIGEENHRWARLARRYFSCLSPYFAFNPTAEHGPRLVTATVRLRSNIHVPRQKNVLKKFGLTSVHVKKSFSLSGGGQKYRHLFV